MTQTLHIRTIGIAGLGLIGASMAKAVRNNLDCMIYADDIQDTVLYQAREDRLIDGLLRTSHLAECDLVFLALYPSDAVNWLDAHARQLKRGCLVIDCCGVKRSVAQPLQTICEREQLCYIGGHPMAGREFSGYAASETHLFDGAYMILVSPPEAMTEALRAFFCSIGFKDLQITTAEEHDRIIAYTSQLAHLVSSAYIKSPTAQEHLGFSAGSFRSMTRVAYLNERMWTELFLDNRDYLAEEIRLLRAHLKEYEDCIRSGDAQTLNRLLKEGRERKEKSEEALSHES